MKSRSALPALAILPLLLTGLALAKGPSKLGAALKCVFFVTAFDNNKRPFKSGSAFLQEEDGDQWIHTNAHVIDGGAGIEFKDLQGKIVTGFASGSSPAGQIAKLGV